MFTIFSGNMSSGKSKALIQYAEKLKLMDKKFIVFYPNCCSNGEKNKIYSRSGIEVNAIGINEPLDMFQYILDGITDCVLIDEIQFLSKSEDELNDLLLLVNYLEKNEIDLYIAGLDLDFRGNAFTVTRELFPHADKIKKFYSVCSECKSPHGRKTLRYINGELSMPDEDTLIERNEDGVVYKSVCSKCYHNAYKEC